MGGRETANALEDNAAQDGGPDSEASSSGARNPGVYRVHTAGAPLNIRRDPKKDTNNVRVKAPNGSRIEVLAGDQTNGFVPVKYGDVVGFASASFLEADTQARSGAAAVSRIANDDKVAASDLDANVTPTPEEQDVAKTLAGAIPANKTEDVVVKKVGAGQVKLVLYPGEGEVDGTTVGHLYVLVGGKVVATYDAVGGPPPGRGYDDVGGHTAGATPSGEFVLGKEHHHTTGNWPASVVPFGAKLRENAAGDVEYSTDGKKWRVATGPNGDVTAAQRRFDLNTAKTYGPMSSTGVKLASEEHAQNEAFTYFYQCNVNEDGQYIPGPDGKVVKQSGLSEVYMLNDFGNWAFNMTRNGQQTPWYFHTTAEDEKAFAGGQTTFEPSQSHGCVHLNPPDILQMMERGYLQKGVHVTVMKYGAKGPPK